MRLIDADKLKDEFIGEQELWHYTGIRAWIDSAPTVDAVHVVRCKNCIHYTNCEIEFVGQFGDNSYCCCGEREVAPVRPLDAVVEKGTK